MRETEREREESSKGIGRKEGGREERRKEKEGRRVEKKKGGMKERRGGGECSRLERIEEETEESWREDGRGDRGEEGK